MSGEISGRRRHVTVLFADIKDSTKLIEHVDAEAAGDLLGPLIHLMAAVVRSHSGSIARILGDGILAIFGAPRAVENHAVLACHAALALRDSVARASRAGLQPQLRIGIASGDIVISAPADATGADYDVVGLTVHLASRIEGLAPGDAIYIAPQTYREVRPWFDCVPRGEKEIKGLSRRVKIYELIAARADLALPDSAEAQGMATPLIGRAGETALLAGLCRDLRQGHGGFLALVGEAGSGKSRLAQEFIRLCRAADVDICVGQCRFSARAGALSPVVQILEALCGVPPLSTSQGRAACVRDRVARLFPDGSGLVVPSLFTLMGIELDDEQSARMSALDPESRKRQVMRTVHRLLRRAALERPTLVVIEDADWLDPSSVELAEHILSLCNSVPLLLMVLSRGSADALDTKLIARAERIAMRATKLAVPGLSTEEGAALVDQLATGLAIPRDMRGEIVAHAGGNPLYICEAMQTVWEIGTSPEIGATKGRADPWTAVPGPIQDVIMTRVDHLEAPLRDLLLRAAVIGPQFDVTLLRAVAEASSTFEAALSILQSKGFVAPVAGTGDRQYAFTHPLLHEVLYESLLVKDRRVIHQRIANLIEFSADGAPAALLAYHFTRAETWHKAHHHLLSAADDARRLTADAEALALYTDAITAHSRSFGDRWDPHELALIERKVGEAHYRRGDHSRAAAVFESALVHLGDAPPASLPATRRAILLELVRQGIHRLLPEGWVELPEGLGPNVAERLRIYRMMWWIMFFRSPEALLLYTLKTINLAERTGDPEGMARGAATLGFLCDVLRFRPAAALYHRRSVRLARRSGSGSAEGFAFLGLGWHDTYAGRWKSADESFGQAIERCWEAGHIFHWGSATWGRILLRTMRGEFPAAERDAAELLRISRQSADKVNQRWGTLAHGILAFRLGRHADALEILGTVYGEAKSIPDYQLLPHAAAELACCHIARGEMEQARLVLEQTESLIAGIRFRGHHLSILANAKAEWCIARLAAAGTGDSLSHAAAAAEACREASRGGRVFRGALPNALRLSGALAWHRGRRTQAEGCWRRSTQVAAGLGSSYEVARTEITVGTLTGDQAMLERGRGLLRQGAAGSTGNDRLPSRP